MTEPTKAVFLSYASQDAAAAGRLSAALRAAGIEVWFDQSELRGGDAWDQRIRREIRQCTLFLPIISANTQARAEGYFRLEWRMADQRTHLMGRARAFIVPVCIDDTPDVDADVPDSFMAAQWTRLPGGDTPPAFVARVRNLLQADGEAAPSPGQAPRAPDALSGHRATRLQLTPKRIAFSIALSLALSAAGYFGLRHLPPAAPVLTAAPPSMAGPPAASNAATFSPPPHSVAVLPFVNMSGDASQEYFSDGLSEELLDALVQVDSLRVAARTSSFSFKGKDVDVETIARRLNVGTVLEGSVRRAGRKVRIAAQLIDGTNGFHLWSESYDEDLNDVLSVQRKVASAVAAQLNVSLSGNALAKIGQGGTRNPEAFDAYLRGAHLLAQASSSAAWDKAAKEFEAAIHLDPHYAAAYALQATALVDAWVYDPDAAEHRNYPEQARAAADRAVQLAPDFAEAYEARASVRAIALLDFGGAGPDFERAVRMAPGSALTQKGYASYASIVGHTAEALAANRRAVELDPENYAVLQNNVINLMAARHYDDALAATESLKASYPNAPWRSLAAFTYIGSGRPDKARDVCEPTLTAADPLYSCLAVAYHALGRTADAESALQKEMARSGDHGAYNYATVYAQWGDKAATWKWLNIAARNRSPAMQRLRSEALLDPIRGDPAFKELEKQFNYP